MTVGRGEGLICFKLDFSRALLEQFDLTIHLFLKTFSAENGISGTSFDV